jgi:diamine N-acetyltransferase
VTSLAPVDAHVRRARADEAAALASLAARTFVEAYPTLEHDDVRAFVDQHMTVERVAADLRDPRIVTHVALVGERHVGYSMLRLGQAAPPVVARRQVELARIYVDTAWHGRGVAGLLLAAAIVAARAWGGDALWLGVWEGNPRAIRFYEKHGFATVGSQPFELASVVHEDLVMAMSLA